METEIKLGPLTREQQNRIFEDTVRLIERDLEAAL